MDLLQRARLESYIYNASSATRITGRECLGVIVFKGCNTVNVLFKKGQGLRPRFMSKDIFKQHFAEYRKQAGRFVKVEYSPLTGIFHAQSARNMHKVYQVELFPEKVTCNCGDWKKQEELGISTPMCKHAYAALDLIGCSSLKDYVERDGFRFLDHSQYIGEDEDKRAYYEERYTEEHYLW